MFSIFVFVRFSYFCCFFQLIFRYSKNGKSSLSQIHSHSHSHSHQTKCKTSTQQQKLGKVTCPVCNKEIVDLKRHLINIHKWDSRDARLARQNLGLRLQKKSPKRVRKERICPYENCGKVVKCLKNHLRQTHRIRDDNLFKECLKQALYSVEEMKYSSSSDLDASDVERKKTGCSCTMKKRQRKRQCYHFDSDDGDKDEDADWIDQVSFSEFSKVHKKRI